MASFTMELKYVIEKMFGSTLDPDEYEQQYHNVTYDGVTYGKLPTVPDWSMIGLGTYPIFDESYRPILNGKIVDEYFNREIGTETIDNFLLIMRKKMDQIMPYYNQIYDTLKIEFDPLSTMDINTEATSDNKENATLDASGNTISNTKSNARSVSQEMPQVMLSPDGDYATSASDTNSGSDVTGNSTNNTVSENSTIGNNTSNTKGYQGVASQLLVRYRNSLINVDMMILDEIKDCFMLVLNNGDAYTQRGWYPNAYYPY